MKILNKLTDALYNGSLCAKIRLFCFTILAISCAVCDFTKNWLILIISVIGMIESIYELKTRNDEEI